MNDRPARTILHEGRWLELVETDGWEYVDRPNIEGVVVILAVSDEGKLILVEQFRKPLGCPVIELPAGLAGDEPESTDESLAEAAGRELLEETGFEATRLEYLTAGPPSPGLSTEVLTFFRATGLKRVHAGGGVAGEEIRVHEVPLDEVDSWLTAQEREGRLVDPKIYTGLYFTLRPSST